MVAFIIWVIVGSCFVGLGIFSFFSEKVTRFCANTELNEINDVKKYNNAMGKLWCSFGIVFIVLGIPLLDEQNSPFIFLSVIGVVVEVITLMIIYTTVIEKKYRKK